MHSTSHENCVLFCAYSRSFSVLVHRSQVTSTSFLINLPIAALAIVVARWTWLEVAARTRPPARPHRLEALTSPFLPVTHDQALPAPPRLLQSAPAGDSRHWQAWQQAMGSKEVAEAVDALVRTVVRYARGRRTGEGWVRGWVVG